MAAHPIRICLEVQNQHADYALIHRTVQEAEELGVDLIANWDHFFPLWADGVPYGSPASRSLDGKHFECWTMLAAWAEQTSRVEIGSIVTCNGFRNPDLLADMARTVDHISGGRLFLGIGSGWCQRCFDEYGYEFGTAGSRLDQLRDDLPRIEARWARLNPPPTRKIPVMIGGGGEKKTLPLVAKHADIWHPNTGDLAILRHKSQVLAQHCADIGRDPSEIVRVAAVDKPEGDPAVIGPPLVDAGITIFTMGVDGPEHDLSKLRRWLAWRDQL